MIVTVLPAPVMLSMTLEPNLPYYSNSHYGRSECRASGQRAECVPPTEQEIQRVDFWVAVKPERISASYLYPADIKAMGITYQYQERTLLFPLEINEFASALFWDSFNGWYPTTEFTSWNIEVPQVLGWDDRETGMHYRVKAQWNIDGFIELEISEWKYEYLWTKRYIELRNRRNHGVFRQE